MNTHAHSGQPGYETEDFKGTYAIWAVPFSLAMLFAFVLVIVLWVPSAASKELKLKDLAGAVSAVEPTKQHLEEDAQELGAIEKSMAAIVRESASR
jgi:hypothetical protein